MYDLQNDGKFNSERNLECLSALDLNQLPELKTAKVLNSDTVLISDLIGFDIRTNSSSNPITTKYILDLPELLNSDFPNQDLGHVLQTTSILNLEHSLPWHPLILFMNGWRIILEIESKFLQKLY